MASFDNYINTLLKHEGGFVNDPDDPGGATKLGITLNTWRKYGHDIDGNGTIDVNDIKLLTPELAAPVYKTMYWDKVGGDFINYQPLAEIVFDHAVNAGPWRAVKMLQHLLNTKFGKNLATDGQIGPNTLNAVNSVNGASLYNKYRDLRESYYNYRANLLEKVPADTATFLATLNLSPSDTAKKYINGWLNRVWSFEKKKYLTLGGLALLTIASYLVYTKVLQPQE